MGKFRLKTRYLLLFLLVLVSIYSLTFSKSLFYPSNFKLIKGEIKNLNISFPFSLDNMDVSIVETIFNEGKKSIKLNGVDEGNTNIQVRLLGLIPVKNYNINVVNRPELVPGGNAIGVKMNTKGVLVVAVTDIIDTKGNRSSPAREAGLKVGDSIIEIDGEKIQSAEQVVKILNNIKDKAVNMVILRNKNEIKMTAKPIQSLQDNSYRLGIWVRDKTSGIGTMTFYHKESNKFGALGHGIADVDTGKLLNVENGLVMNAKISDLEQGKKGVPGEIKGVFYKTDDVLGEIYDNNDYGIYGVLKGSFDIKTKETLPIGYRDEVRIGKAYILSTLDDNKIEKYEIEIVRLENQERAAQKSMIVKITDEKLLAKTGGIIQGMSGSPIIQDGKLIGAVTHVFVNDPTKGYGIYIEWMLENIK